MSPVSHPLLQNTRTNHISNSTELRGRRPRLDRRVGTRLSFHGGLPRRVPLPGRVLVPQAERSLVVSSSPTSDTSEDHLDARQEGSRRSGLE